MHSSTSNLNAMLVKRKAMRILYPKCVDQDPANLNHVFKLVRLGNGQYQMFNIVSGLPGNRPDGAGWVFVIVEDSPCEVLCGKADYTNVHGHTSLSGMREYNSFGKVTEVERGAYYAGELVFKSGELVRWSNGSGHFLPSRELAFTNLLPPVKYILPIHLFRPDD